jgi:hypothetical protein
MQWKLGFVIGYVSSVSCTNSVDACSEVSQEEEIEGRLGSKHICGYRLDY